LQRRPKHRQPADGETLSDDGRDVVKADIRFCYANRTTAVRARSLPREECPENLNIANYPA
jgi:hypothetical protein